MTAGQKLGEKMYADDQATQAAAAGSTAGAQPSAGSASEHDANVVDAEVKEVKKD